jgi:large subunit ribosomal protein L3
LQVRLPDTNNLDELHELAGKWQEVSTAFGLLNGFLGAIDGWLPRTKRPSGVDNPADFNVGQLLNVESFVAGQLINVTGKSIGKGFSGLQKRYNFARGPMTHGSKNHRAPGSIGMGTSPGRVLPGKKMAGQLGNKMTNIKKLKIVQVNNDENILVIKGAVPGKPGNLLSIVPSK